MTFCLASVAWADPPVRVARLAYASEAVSLSPAGEDQWVAAGHNRPLVGGDRLWSAADSRAELQLDGSVLWLGGGTSLNLTTIDDRLAQFELPQGTLSLWVRRMPPGHALEIDTPNLAFSVTHPGRYRLEVDPPGQATTVVVRDGQADVYGEGAAYRIAEGRAYRFLGTDLGDSQAVDAVPDAFDRWTARREARFAHPASVRYVSPSVIGYEDLDEYGVWRTAAPYGHVWYPRQVPLSWAPYTDGHWAWIDPWGWTWVDDAPWGFAPFHYGRWVYAGGAWGWVPGPAQHQPVYAPALVMFVSGSALLLPGSREPAIGWFPLGPQEVYRPPYPVSEGYFRDLNASGTVVEARVIDRAYQDYRHEHGVIDRHHFANLNAPGAVTGMPRDAFARAVPVNRVAVSVPPNAAAQVSVAAGARVAPVAAALLSAAALAEARPPKALERRSIIAKTPPPPPPVARGQPPAPGGAGASGRAKLPRVKVVAGLARPTASPPARRSAASPAQPGRPPGLLIPAGPAPGKAGAAAQSAVPGPGAVRGRDGEAHAAKPLPRGTDGPWLANPVAPAAPSVPPTRGKPYPDAYSAPEPASKGGAPRRARQGGAPRAGPTFPGRHGPSSEGGRPRQGPWPKAEQATRAGQAPTGGPGASRHQTAPTSPAHGPPPGPAVPAHRETPRQAAPPARYARPAPTTPKPPPPARVPARDRQAQPAPPIRAPGPPQHPAGAPHAAVASPRPGPVGPPHVGAPQHPRPAAPPRPGHGPGPAAPRHPRSGSAPDRRPEAKGG